MSSEDLKRVMDLAGSSYRPKEIVDLQQKIEAETRAVELHASITGKVDEAKVQEIVGMKFELERLYSRWLAGDIS